jgi:phage protein D
MKPAFRVTASGNDITQQISDRLLSIRVQDQAGQQSDTLEITLDDRGQELPLPEEKSELKVALGYSHEGNSPQEMGTYVVDEVEINFPPATIKVRAKAMEASGSFKEQKTRSWHEKTIGEITTQIAGEHGLTPQVHPSYRDRIIDHIDQTEESDAHFLTRLAGLHGATSKPAEGMLVFIPQGAGLSATGQELPAAVVDVKECSDYRASVKDRGAYAKIETKYVDRETGTEQTVESGVRDAKGGFNFLDALLSSNSSPQGGTTFRDRRTFQNRQEALDAADALSAQLASGTVTIDLTCAGRPDIFSERPITLTGFREPLNGTWVIQSVTHEYSGRGYSTKITCGTETPESDDGEGGGSGANDGSPPTEKARLISDAAAKARGMNTRNGPDRGNNACLFAVNKVLRDAGVTPPWGNSNYVPDARAKLAAGAGTKLNGPEPGAIAIMRDNGSPPYPHIGIVQKDGNIISNSSSRGSFSWVAPPSSYDRYYGRTTEYWRLK